MKTLIGIDWSQAHHDVRIHNEHGACLARFRIPHTEAGFQDLKKRISQFNPKPEACLVAIETAVNLLVDFLWSCHYRLYVIAPSYVNSSRGRQRTSGARDDDSDAALLTDILRTDRRALIPWQPDGAQVQQMRQLLSFIDDLTASIVQYGNRLRTMLQRYYPQPLSAFSGVDVPLCLHFLIAYPTPTAAATLTFSHFQSFCRQHGDRRRDHQARRFAKLQQPAPIADAALLAIYQTQMPWLAQQLLHFVQQKKEAITHLQQLFTDHEDHHIFASLPGTGDLLAPKLLVIFGDHRRRLPTAAMIQGLAGTCPVTIRSGKYRSVRFRRACNRSFRHTAQQFARASISQSPWAAAYYLQARERGLSESHAFRCLANRWLKIIWTLWQRRLTYDETYHLQQVHTHRRSL
jgi:transposase